VRFQSEEKFNNLLKFTFFVCKIGNCYNSTQFLCVARLWYKAYLITSFGHGTGETAFITIPTWRRNGSSWLCRNFRRQRWAYVVQFHALKFIRFNYKIITLRERVWVTHFSQMILSFRMTMEHVIACEAKQILHTLFTFYDLTDSPA
jgi:hypothetical protein